MKKSHLKITLFLFIGICCPLLSFAQSSNIVYVTPQDSVDYDPESLFQFIWTAPQDYEGTFKFRLVELEYDEDIPSPFPDDSETFFVQENLETSVFDYPLSAPQLSYDKKYVWAIDLEIDNHNEATDRGLISGGPFFPIPQFFFSKPTGIPNTQLCPGDCFILNLTINHASSVTGGIIAYADFPNAIEVNNQNAYDISLLDNIALESPNHGNTVSASPNIIQVCITDGNTGPIQFSLYGHENTTACTNMPLGSGCKHGSFNLTIDVANVPLVTNPGTLDITDLPGGTALTEICSGDPAYFKLTNLCVPPSSGNQPIINDLIWEYTDDGGTTWNTINDPDFNGRTCMTIIGGHPLLSIDCSTSTTGFLDRIFRAIHSDPANTSGLCTQISSEKTIRICCPLSTTNDPTTLTVTPSGNVCEGDQINLVAQINATFPYIVTPAGDIMITWEIDGNPQSQYDNQTSIPNYSTIATPPGTTVTATITNCAGKSLTLTHTIGVDLIPVCGTLTETSGTPTQTSVDPIVYSICDGNDAVLEAIGFNNCQPNWEISPDLNNWTATGSLSNIQQNTNILLPNGWGTSDVYYRVVCNPPPGSSCLPCIGDTLLIQIVQAPTIPLITGNLDICDGDVTTLQISNPETNVNYTWYCNGLAVGNGNSITSMESACYWVEASNACETVVSATSCVEMCEVKPIISCPLPPNECACLGIPITLDACLSESTCNPPSALTYNWSWNSGTPQNATTCTISDTPPLAGTEYFLTVTDNNSGCTAASSIFIKPCDKQ